jgi:iron(III) transport system substrate-binding protein
MRWTLLTLLSLALLAGCDQPASESGGDKADDQEINVYSARKEALIQPLLDRFAEKTGAEVNLITGGADALIERMKSEGEHSPADLLLTVDAGRLYRARQADLLQKTDSQALQKAVPEQYRHPEGFWHGLSVRSRVLVVAPDRVPEDAPSRYEDLADERWEERICIRSSNNIYNQSLVASLIAHNGEQATEQWANGLVANMARSPQGGDRDQILAVANDVCDIAVVNTYYLAMMHNSDDPAQREAAEQVALRWPNQGGRGAHVNISGAGVARHAPHPDQARALLEFLVSDESQQWYAEVNNEYPVKDGVAISKTLREWGDFKADELPLVKLGKNNDKAVRLMDRAGWQ